VATTDNFEDGFGGHGGTDVFVACSGFGEGHETVKFGTDPDTVRECFFMFKDSDLKLVDDLDLAF
jgi:hypothetical protein